MGKESKQDALENIRKRKEQIQREIEEDKRRRLLLKQQQKKKDVVEIEHFKEPEPVKQEPPKVKKKIVSSNMSFADMMKVAAEREKMKSTGVKQEDGFNNLKRSVVTSNDQIPSKKVKSNQFNKTSEYTNKIRTNVSTGILAQSSISSHQTSKVIKDDKVKASDISNKLKTNGHSTNNQLTQNNATCQIRTNSIKRGIAAQNGIGCRDSGIRNTAQNLSINNKKSVENIHSQSHNLNMKSNKINELPQKSKLKNTSQDYSNSDKISINNKSNNFSQKSVNTSKNYSSHDNKSNGYEKSSNQGITSQNSLCRKTVTQSSTYRKTDQNSIPRGNTTQKSTIRDMESQNSTVRGIAAQNSTNRGISAQNPANRGIAAQNSTNRGIAAQNPANRGITAQNSFAARGIAAQNASVRGIAAQNYSKSSKNCPSRYLDSDEDEDYDDLDDFIDDTEASVTDEIRKEIYSSLKFDPNRYAKVSKYDTCNNMEVGVQEIWKEEKRSAYLAKKEDAEEQKLEEERLKRKGKLLID